MIRFIHTGDIHLGLQFNNVSFNQELAKERRRELWSTFEGMVNHAVKEDLNFLLLAGDIFETEYFTLGDIKRLRDILKEARNVNVVISAGNHDYINDRSLYGRVEWSPNVHIFTGKGIGKKEFAHLNTIVYGYSWDRIEIKDNSLFDDFISQDTNSNKILLIHGDLAGTSNYLPLDLNLLKSLDMDYIALGHIHKPQIISNKIAYCGCLEPLDFGETGHRGFIQGSISNKVSKIEFIPFSKRIFLNLDLKINENMGYLDIVRAIKEINVGSKESDFYRVKLKGYIQNDLDLDGLIKDLKENFYYIEIINETIPDYDLEALERDFRENIIGQFINEMKKKGLDNELAKDALYYGLEALLKGRVV